MTPTRPDLRAQGGFSMFLVIMAMFLTSMFIAAAFAAANGDLPVSGDSKNRKSTYAAAEAGLNFYLNHLQQDNDYWTLCDQVPAPNATEVNPVNQQWDGTTPATDTRRWRTIPGSTAQYTVEVLHNTGYSKCETDPNKQASVIDLATGTFKIRVTGRPSLASKQRRAIIAAFRRKGFLNFIYFTDFETIDPQALSNSSDRSTAQTNCGDKYRAARAGKGCSEIQFVTGDEIKGPLHTNDDSLLTCGTPVFGRSGRVDPIEVSGPSPGFVRNTGCSGDPSVAVGKITTAKQMSMPTSNDQLADVAAAGGTVYSGKTVVRLKTGGLMDVTNYDASGAGTTTTNVPWPVNGVLYVKNNGACTGEYPTAAKYTESATCGNVYVSGTYGQSLTIAAANDVIVRPTLGGKLSNKSNDGSLIRQSGTDATLGLIANNFVRVAHPIARNTDGSCNDNLDTTNDPVVMNVQIDAAILSLQHSFIVDNYNCGRLATLTVNGAIAQKYRGPVGTGNGANPATGFLKNYTYDDRFRYRSPPYFMNPVDASWDIIRSHEQVPAR